MMRSRLSGPDVGGSRVRTPSGIMGRDVPQYKMAGFRTRPGTFSIDALPVDS